MVFINIEYFKFTVNIIQKEWRYKMIKSKTEDKKNYYLEYMKIYLQDNETVGNFFTIYDNYKSAYQIRKNKIDTLYNEIKVIKKLKV